MRKGAIRLFIAAAVCVVMARVALAESCVHGWMTPVEDSLWMNAVGEDAGNGNTRSDQGGQFTISHLPPGTYESTPNWTEFVLPDGMTSPCYEWHQAPEFPPALGNMYMADTYHTRKAGQSFVANGRFLSGVLLVQATSKQWVHCSIYDHEPPIAPGEAPLFDLGCSYCGYAWFKGYWAPADPTQAPLIPGHKYYAEFISGNCTLCPGTPDKPCIFNEYMCPAKGADNYKDGTAWVEDEVQRVMVPRPQEETGVSVWCQTPGRVRDYDCGSSELPLMDEVWQVFTAKGTSLRYVYCGVRNLEQNGPWDMWFEIHQYTGDLGNPMGPKIGPKKRSKPSPYYGHGIAAMWATGEVPLVPGQKYLLKLRRAEKYMQGPFQIDMLTNASGEHEPCFESGTYNPSLMMAGSIWSDEVPYDALTIANVQVTSVGATKATVEWDTQDGAGTAHAAMTQVRYWVSSEDDRRDSRYTTLVESETTHHRVGLSCLRGGQLYHFRVLSYSPSHVWATQEGTFTTTCASAFSGAVMDQNAAPIEGAKVEVSPSGGCDWWALSGANGSYAIANVEPGTYTLTCSKVGYTTETKTSQTVAPCQTKPTDFTLIGAFGQVANGGFEAPMPDPPISPPNNIPGWSTTCSTPAIMSPPGYTCSSPPGYPGVMCGQLFGSFVAPCGPCAGGGATNWYGWNGWLHQNVNVHNGKPYELSAVCALYYKGGNNPGTDCWMRIGVDPQGRDGTVPPIGTVYSPQLKATANPCSIDWTELTCQATPVSGQVTVWLQYWQSQGEWRVNWFDCVTLTCKYSSLSELKKAKEGERARATGLKVTATQTDLDGERVYVESPDRSSGIQVYLGSDTAAVAEGDVVTVDGTVTTRDGERSLEAPEIVKTGSGTALAPLAMTIRELGGADYFYESGTLPAGQRGVTNGVGVNNIGLLVRVAGVVKSVSPEQKSFEINDGSYPSQGPLSGVEYLKVDASALSSLPAALSVGDYVAVTGLSCADESGNYLLSVLRVRRAGDLAIASDL